MAVADPGEDHPQHGRRRGEAGHQDARGRRSSSSATIAGQQPERAPREEVDRHLQGPRGHAGRRRGDAAPRPHVGVPRPPDLDRDPAHPRLPRPQPPLLRRPRQLLDGRPRADHLPRDRLRLDRRGPRPRRHDHHHRRDRRGGVRAARRARHAVLRRGPSRRGRHGRRGGGGAAQGGGPPARRGRGRPPWSSSRRRTPRPTPSRERPEEGEEGEEGEGGERRGRRGSPRARGEAERGLRRGRTTRRRRTDGQDITAGAPGAPAQVQDPRVQPLPPLRPLARLLPQVRPLPDLPARARPTRATSPA